MNLMFLFLFACGWIICESVTVPRLIIITYSGLNNEYFKRNVTPFMNNLKNNGVHADHMDNFNGKHGHLHHLSFQDDSISGVQGIAKEDGLHNPKFFNHSFGVFTYHGDIMPIWIVNELSGENRSSGVMMWPGGEFSFNGTKATYVKEYDDIEKWEWRIDLLISWFKDADHPINLAMLYFEDSKKPIRTNEFLAKVDNAAKYLYDKLKENNLTDINVIHISDDSNISLSAAKVINITGIIGEEHYDIVGTPSTRFIKPRKENKEKIFGKLTVLAEVTQGFDVFWTDSAPDIVHVQKNLEINQILIVAKDGYVFEDIVKTFAVWDVTLDLKGNQSEVGKEISSNEGVLNEFKDAEDDFSHPRAFFFATGPAFRENCTLQPFSSSDLFPLFCRVLDIDYESSEQSIEVFEECLMKIEEESSYDMFVIGLIILLLFLIITGIIIFYAMRRRRQQKLNIEEYSKSQGATTLPR